MSIYLVLSLLIAWLSILTYIVIKTKNHYDQLIKKTRKERLDEILDMILAKEQHHQIEIEKINKLLNKVNDEGKKHFQKIGIIRFNPFDRVGGEQSFVLSILDELDNGVVVNFIYTKEGIRVYTKKIKGGQGVGFELSNEEKKAINSAS